MCVGTNGGFDSSSPSRAGYTSWDMGPNDVFWPKNTYSNIAAQRANCSGSYVLMIGGPDGRLISDTAGAGYIYKYREIVCLK